MSMIPDLSKAERNGVEIEINGKFYIIPPEEVDKLEPIFENMNEKDLETEIKKIAIINNIKSNPMPPPGSVINIM